MKIEAPPPIDNKDDFQAWIERFWYKTQDDHLYGSVTWSDPASIPDGDELSQEVTVSGAVLGDMAIASYSLDVQDLVLDAQVTAENTVTCVLANNTGGGIDLAEGTVSVRVFKKIA